MRRLTVVGVPIDLVDLAAALTEARRLLGDGGQHYVVTPNPEMAVLVQRDPSFAAALGGADLALLDGAGLAFALRLCGTPAVRVPGVEFLTALLREARGETFFFLGAAPGVARAAAVAAASRYGTSVVGVAAPPFDTYRDEGALTVVRLAAHDEVLRQITAARPAILVVALGHGQQEKWIAQFLSRCPSVRLAIGVGGALDYLSGRQRRAPTWLRHLGFEWLWRLGQQPWRWRRIVTATMLFPLYALRWYLSMRLRFRESVVGCVVNRRGEVLLVERARPRGHWQFPQGGREQGETPAEAVLREMTEELGTTRFAVVGQSRPGVHRYVWKKVHLRQDVAAPERRYGFKGQRQTILYLKFLGEDADIKVDNREHVAWRWVARADLRKVIHPLRRRVATIALKDLARLGV